MKIQTVERYTLHLERGELYEDAAIGGSGTTVGDLIQALLLLPRDAYVQQDYGTGMLNVLHYKPDVEAPSGDTL